MGSGHRQPGQEDKEVLHWVEKNEFSSGPSSFLGDTFTLLSWNVFKGFYEEKLVDIMHSLIVKHQPDAIVLQEAPMYADDSFIKWPKEFQPASLSYVSSQKKIPRVYEFEHTGELTAARMPHLKSSFHLFPKVTDQRHFHQEEYLHRNYIYTQWQTRSGSLGLYNVHLESVSTPLKRLAEVKALYDVIEEHDDDITLIAGDFNTIMGQTLEPAMLFLKKKGFVNGLLPGLQQIVPRLDHVFVRGAKEISTQVLPRVGSDHRPLVARILL